MSAYAATPETTAAAKRRRRVAAGGSVIAAETAGVIICGPEGIGVAAAHIRIVCRGVGHSGAKDGVAGTGRYAIMREPALIVGGIERSEIVINGVCRTSNNNIAAAIVWVIEIRVIPAVPDKVIVPHHIGVAESKAHAVAGSEEGAVTESIVGRTKAVPETTAIIGGCGGIIGVG